MLSESQKDLLAFLAESANELAAKAHWASASDSRQLIAEAEELMAIRTNILNRHWEAAKANQFELPFAFKQAA